MSGQYPPPNPFSRAPLHQHGPPSQGLLPPWGHSSQPAGMNVVGSPLNFYGPPHMTLTSRGAQPWVPPQSHPKPSDTHPMSPSVNPLFGLQMYKAPDDSHRIPTQYQQEETMDLSSHSTSIPDVPKIISARSENIDPLRNGTILPAEVNGDLNRTEPEVKESIVTSVIAANPLRESADPLNCSRLPENSVVRKVEPEKVDEFNVDTSLSLCVKNDGDSSRVGYSEPVDSMVSSLLQTSTCNTDIKSEDDSVLQTSTSNTDTTTVDKDELTNSDQSTDFPVDDAKPDITVAPHGLEALSENIGSCEKDLFSTSYNKNESQSLLDSSSLSIDTDESKLVVADSSAEDIFGISPVNNVNTPAFQDMGKCEELKEPSAVPVSAPEKLPDSVPVALTSNEQWQSKTPSVSSAPSVVNTEPHPSVENVEILLESMFNSQEETSCSSQNSSSSVPQSVIVSSGSKVSAEVTKPAIELITPMKEEELAMTLAEDTPIQENVKDEKKEVMDDIEKELEMLTENKSCDLQNFKPIDNKEEANLLPELIKEEPANVAKNNDEKDSSILLPDVNFKTTEQVDNPVLAEPKSEAGSSSNPFIEVETELEKMFAGIVEPADEVVSDNLSQPSVSEQKKPIANKRSTIKRKKTNYRRPSDNSVFGGSSGDSTPVKKKGRKRMNESGSERVAKKIKFDDSLKKGKVIRDTNNDSLSSKVKGPFVHIEGSKESPASVVVVNSGVRIDDEDGVDKASSRRKHSTLQRPEGTLRRAGQYSSSTLSMRYNSDQADLSWVCVFCKRGPHCPGPEPAGDLFGPYRIPATQPGDDAMPSGTPADRDIMEEQKRRGGKYPKSLRASGGADHFVQKLSKKSKRSQSCDSVESQPGLLSVDGGYEVWLHGHCAEWAPGLCIIGTQLVGLDDAVWTALRTKCCHCGTAGAGVGCVVHNCTAKTHYPCAHLTQWLLDSESFIARCHTHRTRPRPS